MNKKFWSKVIKTDSCWLWTGYLNESGYGRFRNKQAHRFSYEDIIGKIKKGLILMHLCDVRNCVNPSHLKQATQSENMIDASKKGRTLLAFRKKFFPTRTINDYTRQVESI